MSKIDNITKEELQKLFDESKTRLEVLKKIGVKNYSMLNKRITEDKINLDKFNINFKKYIKEQNIAITSKKKISIDKILIEHSSYGRVELKKRLVAEKNFDYMCAICSNIGEWMGKPLTLHLDHINGINDDN
jgi:hypothetical protein